MLKNNNKKINIPSIIYSIIMLLGIFIIFYPVLINYLNSKKTSEVITNYENTVKHMSKEEKKELIEKARIYNDNLINDKVNPNYNFKEEYNNILNIDENGLMEYILIPKIKLNLPIYHTVSDEVLNKYIGHYTTSSFPVGGKGTNALLFGHRGLPSATLFTDLDQVKINDIFYTNILDKKYTYKVVDIKVVNPNDIKEIVIDKNKDQVTLITCTPYAINTHRLIIVGERYKISNKKLKEIKVRRRLSISELISLISGLLIVVILLIYKIKKMRNNELNPKSWTVYK